MTDRIRTLTVILDNDYRDDCIEDILLSIRMIKGVASAKPGKPDNDYIARSVVKHELREKMVKLWEELA